MTRYIIAIICCIMHLTLTQQIDIIGDFPATFNAFFESVSNGVKDLPQNMKEGISSLVKKYEENNFNNLNKPFETFSELAKKETNEIGDKFEHIQVSTNDFYIALNSTVQTFLVENVFGIVAGTAVTVLAYVYNN